MATLLDANIDSLPLAGKRVAIIGFGNQGRAQALNLRDSGIGVLVGLRTGSPSAAEVAAADLPVASPAAAAEQGDIVMLLAPDEQLAAIYEEIAPRLRPETALGFSHGLAVHFGLISPRPDLDVFMVAPKGPGTALRANFLAGGGLPGLFAVAQDATGGARGLALAYGRAIGCGRAGLIETSFAVECEADLFNEAAVVWGGVPELVVAGFDTLVEAGTPPELAWFECVGELKLLADLIDARGIAGMREAISNTAEFASAYGGRRIVTDATRAAMRDLLAEVRSGRMVSEMMTDARGGSPRLAANRADQAGHAVDQIGARLAGARAP